MNQVIRILSLAFRYGKRNIRYKIVYLRTNYSGYDVQNGDILDNAIYDYFAVKNPININWEYKEIHNPNTDFSRYLNGFDSRNILLFISAEIDESLSIFELDNLVSNSTTFPVQNRLVTLFFTTNMNETDDNYIYLPTDIRVAINSSIYASLSQTIFPYL